MIGSEYVERCPLTLPDFVPKAGGAELVIEGAQFSKIIPWNPHCGRDMEMTYSSFESWFLYARARKDCDSEVESSENVEGARNDETWSRIQRCV